MNNIISILNKDEVAVELPEKQGLKLNHGHIRAATGFSLQWNFQKNKD